jgi:hypothetical protein
MSSGAALSAEWPVCEIPEPPPARGYETSASAELRARYEDIAQDGRFHLPSLMTGLGAVWRARGHTERLATFREQGVLPILRRIVMIGEKGPFSVHAPIQVSGTWRLAREKDGDRIFLNMWLEARAPIGFTLAEPPPRDAEQVLAGRVFAEHVMTKPFAPPAERKVTHLDSPGLPPVPEDEHPFIDAKDLVEGHALEPAREVMFGMVHTDSNQHVNSLVYPRLFEETVGEHLMKRSARGSENAVPEPQTLLASALELRYRKPFFAGDRATLAIHAAPVSKAPYRAVAVGSFGGATPGKPSCAVAAWLW